MSNLKLPDVHDHASAQRFLGKRESKRMAYNTTIRRIGRYTDDDAGIERDFAVRYVATDIVTNHADGTITLHTGGWDTTTTTNRMHRLTPAHIWVNRHDWQTVVTDRFANKTWRGITRHLITPIANA